MGTKAWIVFGVLTAAVLGGLVYMSQSNRLDVSEVNTATVLKANDQSGNIADNARGAIDSGNLLVEYGDFQCPGCAAIYPHVETLMDEYGDKIAFVYRDFPLASIHPNALAAATAAEAAGLQGKFWDMYNYLYTNQNDWQSASASERKDVFTSYASQLNLDTDRFKTDYDSSAVKQKIDYDLALGSKDNVTGTPSFFFNGQRLPDDIEAALGQGQLDTVKDWLDKNIK